MKECTTCAGLGLAEGCPSCGTYNYNSVVQDDEILDTSFRIPMYYKKNLWSSSKLRTTSDKYCNAVLSVLDNIVTQVSNGGRINSSYAFMLPYAQGKKTAMYTIVQKYLENGYTVAPIIDVASLAIMENNFRLNERDAVKAWKELVSADLVCVYGVDFSARYHTMKLYLNLCSIRGLQDRPTLLFAENSLNDLKSKDGFEHVTPNNNNEDVCKLTNPYILDAVHSGRVTR